MGPPGNHSAGGHQPGLWRLVLFGWAVMVLLLLVANIHSIAQQRFPDPDDQLRLQQVRDLLGGQGWFDLHQHRINPHDGGVPMHWSRMVDVPLAGLILLLRPVLGPSLAEQVTVVVVPMLTLLCVVALVARLAWRWLGPRVARFACLLVLMAGPLIAQLQPRRIDHHGWQVVAALGAANGLMMRDARRGGWLAGLATVAGLTVSLEGLPVAVGFALAGAWRWLRGGEQRLWLAHYMGGLAVGGLALFAGFHGFADLAEHCDQLSPVHLTIFAFGAVALAGLGLARRLPLWAVLAGFAAIGAVALGLYLGLAPQCRHGAFNMLTPRLQHLWLNNVAEGLPVWRQPLMLALQLVITPAAALVGTLWLTWRAPIADRPFWRDYALVLVVAIAVAMMVQRASALVFALGAPPLGWALDKWLEKARARTTAAGRLAGLLALALIVVPYLPLALYQSAHDKWFAKPASPQARRAAAGEPNVADCDLAHVSGALARAPRGLVLAPLDMGPGLLLATPQSVLASGHHRGARAMDAEMEAFTSPVAHAHAIVRREGITYVALCPGLTELSIYTAAAPHGFAADLVGGRAPGWLAAMPSDPRLRLWRVVG